MLSDNTREIIYQKTQCLLPWWPQEYPCYCLSKSGRSFLEKEKENDIAANDRIRGLRLNRYRRIAGISDGCQSALMWTVVEVVAACDLYDGGFSVQKSYGGKDLFTNQRLPAKIPGKIPMWDPVIHCHHRPMAPKKYVWMPWKRGSTSIVKKPMSKIPKTVIASFAHAKKDR